MKLVTVIIPYFKKKKFVIETINSVLKQTYSKFEIILIHDDPYNPDYKDLIKFKKRDKRIKLIKNSKNIGAGFSRNKGIKKAKGFYIAFCDGDDTWKKDKLKKQINFMEKNKINFCFSSYNKIDFRGKKIKSVIAPKNQSFQNLLRDCKIGLSTVILKKKMLKNHKFSNMKTKEDLLLWINLSKKYNLVGYDKILSNWRKLDDSLSANFYQKMKDGFSLYHKHLEFNFLKSLYFLFLLSFNFVRKNFFR